MEVPGLQFGAHEVTFSADHVIKCSVEECEHVKIFAPEAMRKCFLGIYEIEASEYSLSDTQRLILERLAAARLLFFFFFFFKSTITFGVLSFVENIQVFPLNRFLIRG